jgi:hypothetical protein
MKHFPNAMLALVALAAGSAEAASVVVDWLVAQPGGTVSSFTLVDDANAATATGGVAITQGLGFPGLPAGRSFPAGSWSTQPELTDTLTGDASIHGLEFRVVPMAGLASYNVNLQVPSNQPLILVVGGLLKTSTSATDAVTFAAFSDSGFVPVTLRSTNAWSNGLTILDQSVSWNPLTQILSTTAGADGDSQFAFFEVGPLAGGNARVSFAIPAGYGAGSGDSIFIGVGAVIPEPAAAGLLLLGAGVFAGRRSRRVVARDDSMPPFRSTGR